MQTECVTEQGEDAETGLMDFIGMSVEEIEDRLEMATTTANDHMAIADECRRAIRLLEGE
jgi:hypothetical protein